MTGQGILSPSTRQPDDIATDSMIDAEIEAGAIVVFSLSGGKDCGAVAVLANKRLDAMGHPRHLRIAMHADLGRAEWRSTPRQVRAQAKALGVELIVVEAGSGDLVDRFGNRWSRGQDLYRDLGMYHMRGPFSSPALKFCQSEKKIQVMGPALVKRYRGQSIIQVTGLRRDESVARRSTPIAKADHRFVKPGNRGGTRMFVWNPGVFMSVQDVFDANQRHGIPLSEVYELGCSRHSCAACIMGSENDLRIAGAQPDNAPLFGIYIGMEQMSTFSFQADYWLGDRAPHLVADPAAYGQAKIDAARRRALEASLPKRHKFVDGWPLFVPDMDEAVVIAEVRGELLARHGLPNLYPTASKVIDRFACLRIAGRAALKKKE